MILRRLTGIIGPFIFLSLGGCYPFYARPGYPTLIPQAVDYGNPFLGQGPAGSPEVVTGHPVQMALQALPPAYHRPPESASVAEREKIFQQQRVGWTDGISFEVGDRLYGCVFQAEYYKISGDLEASRLQQQANLWRNLSIWGLLAGATAGAVIGFNSVPAHTDEIGDDRDGGALIGILIGGVAVGVSMGLATGSYERDARDHFNEYLAKDLGLAAAQADRLGEGR